jgi:hypothetical protein
MHMWLTDHSIEKGVLSSFVDMDKSRQFGADIEAGGQR